MGNCIISLRRLRFVGTLAIVLIASSAFATGYLAKVGPTRLRFQPIPKNTLVLPPITGDEAKVTATKDDSAASPTTDSSVSSEYLSANTSQSISSESSAKPPTIPQPVNSSARPSTANDLLTVTPQMLVEYFKPSAGSTNGAGTEVLVPVSFTPPQPVIDHPSSKAIYKTQ